MRETETRLKYGPCDRLEACLEPVRARAYDAGTIAPLRGEGGSWLI